MSYFNIYDFITSGEKSLKDENYWSALSVALMLPSMCSRLEYANKECLGTEFADVLYNLRCDIVHAGCANIADGKKRLFFSLGNHCSGLSFEQFRIIDVKQLCECLIGHAKSWCATSNMACIKNTYVFNSYDRDDKLLYDKLCADERAKQLKVEFEKELTSSE